jgi:hypothetical protein
MAVVLPAEDGRRRRPPAGPALKDVEKVLTRSSPARTRRSGTLACFAFRPSHRVASQERCEWFGGAGFW